jgi:hypothetical protein
MTQIAFESGKIQQLVAENIAHEDSRMAAVRRNDIPGANRWFDRSRAVLKDLAGHGPEGRRAIEELLLHPSSFVRLGAAATVHEWAPDLAIPVLADLYLVEREPDASPSERIEICMSAKGLLYRIFGITSYDPDDLIEPLRRYGIVWPSQEERRKEDAARHDGLSGARRRDGP